MSDARGMFGAVKPLASRSPVDGRMAERVGAWLEDPTRATRMPRWGSSGERKKTSESERVRGSGNEKKKSGHGVGGEGTVGVPSYLVIYSPQAPGYPSRGITQGWAHRIPKMSFLRGAPDTRPQEFHLASARFDDRARFGFRV